MKKVLFILIIMLCFVQNLKAQQEKYKSFAYEEYLSLDDSTKEYLKNFLFFMEQSYYSAYLDFTTDFNELLSFTTDEYMFIPSKIKSICINNKDSIRLIQVDSGLFIYYNNELFDFYNNPMNCVLFSCGSNNRTLIRMFDEQGFFKYNKKLIISFQKKRVNLYKKLINEGYQTIIFKDSSYLEAFDTPLIIAYQYDTSNGLSIHKLCSCDYHLEKNLYTQELAALADKFCRRYKLSKIIFAARILK